LHAAWDVADTYQTSYQYSVGLSAGATDVVPWTSTTDKSAALAVTLTPGTTYYVNVQAVYPGGILGPIASTDGITAAILCSAACQAKELANGACVYLSGEIVSGVFSDCFYIQDTQRTSGIKVIGNLGLKRGNVATLTGNTGIQGKETVITNPVLVKSSGGEEPDPIYVNNKALGGSETGLQPASIDNPANAKTAAGLNTTGLLVRTNGKVTYVSPDSTYAYINDGSKLSDGSGNTGVKLSLDSLPIPVVGTTAEVTALCSATEVAGNCARYLRPRDKDDVVFGSVDNWLKNPGFENGAYSAWTYSGTGGSVVMAPWKLGITPYSSTYFFGAYASASICSGCLYQQVDVPDGNYVASVQSRVYHNISYTDAAQSRIGIDPTGGTDPSAPSIVWSGWDTQSRASFSEWKLISTPVTALSGTATVFLQYQEKYTMLGHANCFDDAVLISQ
jgi:hypothetical protein